MDTNISPETPTTSTSSNIVEKAIKIIALVVYACGLIVGIAAGDETGRFLITLLYWPHLSEITLSSVLSARPTICVVS